MDHSRQRVVWSVLGVVLLAVAAVLATPLLAQTSLDIDLTVDTTTVRPALGEVTIAGTVTCSQAVNTFVSVALTQPVGRINSVNGFAAVPVACAGPDVRRFEVRVVGVDGRFDVGIAYLNAFVQGCVVPEPYPGPLPQCDSDQVVTTVRLTEMR